MKLNNTVLIIAIIIISGILGMMINHYITKPEPIQYHTDTLYTHTIDTISITKLVPYKVEVIKTVHDTLPSAIDSIPVPVAIPITQNSYTDTIQTKDKYTLIYNAYISGYKPNLDSLNFKLFKSTKIITNTPIPTKQKKWSIGPFMGVSYDGLKVRPAVGIGIQYSIINW